MKLKPVMDAFERVPATIELAQRIPVRGSALELGGLAGSSGAVLAAWIARTQPQRLVVAVAPTPGEAERWLTDLALLTDEAGPFYRGSSPRFLPSRSAATGYAPDDFRLTQRADGLWTFVAVCDANGCYEAFTV